MMVWPFRALHVELKAAKEAETKANSEKRAAARSVTEAANALCRYLSDALPVDERTADLASILAKKGSQK